MRARPPAVATREFLPRTLLPSGFSFKVVLCPDAREWAGPYTLRRRARTSKRPSPAPGKIGALWRTGRGKPACTRMLSRLICVRMVKAASAGCVFSRTTALNYVLHSQVHHRTSTVPLQVFHTREPKA
jgi:hypothetical protein